MKIPQAILAAGLVLAVTALWARSTLKAENSSNTKGIDSDSRVGAKPTQPSKNAFAAKTAQQIVTQARGVIASLTTIKSSTNQDTRPLVRFNNPASAQAAATAPIRTDYTPSGYAKLN